MGHHHAHDHAPANPARILTALLINVAITLLEFVVGLLVGSLALVADAFHNLSDVVALGLSYFGAKMSLKGPNVEHSFGFGRTEVLVGLGNAVSLVGITIYIFYEAYEKLLHPPMLSGGLILGVGSFSLVGNVASVWILMSSKDKSINMRSAVLHLALDALAALGVMAAAALVMLFGWHRADPAASVLIGALVLWGSLGLLREGIHILMEGVPKDLDLEHIAKDMNAVSGVCGVHDLHLWNLSSTYRALSAHVVVSDSDQRRFDAILGDLRRLLGDRYGIQHVTLEPELDSCPTAGILCEHLSGHAQGNHPGQETHDQDETHHHH